MKEETSQSDNHFGCWLWPLSPVEAHEYPAADEVSVLIGSIFLSNDKLHFAPYAQVPDKKYPIWLAIRIEGAGVLFDRMPWWLAKKDAVSKEIIYELKEYKDRFETLGYHIKGIQLNIDCPTKWLSSYGDFIAFIRDSLAPSTLPIWVTLLVSQNPDDLGRRGLNAVSGVIPEYFDIVKIKDSCENLEIFFKHIYTNDKIPVVPGIPAFYRVSSIKPINYQSNILIGYELSDDLINKLNIIEKKSGCIIADVKETINDKEISLRWGERISIIGPDRWIKKLLLKNNTDSPAAWIFPCMDKKLPEVFYED